MLRSIARDTLDRVIAQNGQHTNMSVKFNPSRLFYECYIKSANLNYYLLKLLQ